MKKHNLRSIVLAALFATLCIVLTYFMSFYVPVFGSNTVRIGFGHIPLLLSGLLLGPFFGAVTGAVADLTGAIAFPTGGAYFPGFTLTAILTGLLPGLMKAAMGRRRLKWIHVLAITLGTELVVSVLLNTYWLTVLSGASYLALLAVRLPVTLCLSLVYTIIVHPLYSRASSELQRLDFN